MRLAPRPTLGNTPTSGDIAARFATRAACILSPGGRRPSWSEKECFIRPGASVGPAFPSGWRVCQVRVTFPDTERRGRYLLRQLTNLSRPRSHRARELL